MGSVGANRGSANRNALREDVEAYRNNPLVAARWSPAYAEEVRQASQEFVRNQEETGTTARNKSFDQIQNEVSQLQDLPAGTQIEREIDGEWVTFTAHDQARMGRNGRMLRRRVYSIVGPGNRRLPVSVTSTTDPYYVAEGRWRRKE